VETYDCICDGIILWFIYTYILMETLFPFIEKVPPFGHWFMYVRTMSRSSHPGSTKTLRVELVAVIFIQTSAIPCILHRVRVGCYPAMKLAYCSINYTSWCIKYESNLYCSMNAGAQLLPCGKEFKDKIDTCSWKCIKNLVLHYK